MDSVDANVNPFSDWVIVKIGDKNGKFRLRSGINSIGRHSASDLRIDSALVSRHHAEIDIPDNEGLYIELRDLNSINGTYINNKLYRADTAMLHKEDIISFGAEYDEEDAAQLPIYHLKFEPLNPTISRTTPVLEIVISDDDDTNDQVDVKPVIPPRPAENIAVSNILAIFGNADETILDGLQRINPIVCEAVKKTSNAELVVLSSDDDEPVSSRKINEQMCVDNIPVNNQPEETKQIDSHNGKKYDSESDNSDAEENQLMYSQALINEMKSEMVDESNESDNQFMQDEEVGSGVKQPLLSPAIISLIDDDDSSEDFDEDLEEKVSNWTNLLFSSQIFPKMNCSQALIPDTSNDQYSSYDEHEESNHSKKTAVVSENSLIENLFKPLEEKLDTKKRTFEENSNVKDVKSSPVVKKKKRKVMQIVDESDESEELNVDTGQSFQELASDLTTKISIEQSYGKSSEVKNKSITTVQPKCRGPPIIVSPPFLKYGRRRSSIVSPKKDSHRFLEKKRRRKPDPKLKELRKERLKTISANKTDEQIDNTTKKLQDEAAKRESKSSTKVKNTMHNRGAFLCELGATSTSVAAKKQSKPQTPSACTNTTNPTAPILAPFNFFAQDNTNLDKCLGEVKKVIRKNAEQARARNAPKKLRFADIEKSYNEQRSIEERRNAIASKLNATLTALTVNAPTTDAAITPADVLNSNIPDSIPEPVIIKKKPKKTVRFKEEPTIYYFESHCEFSRKVDRKDLMPRLSYRHRRTMIRRTFPIVDRTDDIISLILAHSNEWLIKQSSTMTALSTTENISMIPTMFESFEHYKRIFFPLMKLEYMSNLERETKVNFQVKPSNFVLEDIINNKERILLVIKCINIDEQQMFCKKCDLVLLRIGELKTKTFAYMVSCRKSGTFGDGNKNKIFVEILLNSIDADYLSNSKTISMQPAVDNLQVTIGAYNAIHQLESCPLYEILLNPNLLLSPTNVLHTQLDYEAINEITHDNLNREQLNAVQEIYKKICFNKTDTTPNVSIIQGPPGTGKSVVVVNLALQIIYGLGERFRNKKILICSQSNCAIDSVAAKLLEARGRIKDKKHRFFFVRFGIFEKMHPKVHPVSLNNMLEFERVKKLQRNSQYVNVSNWKNHLQKVEEELRALHLQVRSNHEVQAKLDEKKREVNMLRSAYKNALSSEEEHNICKNYLAQCNIVCTTLSSCVKLFQWIDYFDICIIDEATQCTEPWTLLPMKFGISSLVLVGDSQQLPATVLSKQAADYGLTRSLLTRIENNIIDDSSSLKRVNEGNIIFSLRVQYRMHPEICKFPNSYFYKKILKNAENTFNNTTSLMPYSVFNLEYAQNKSSSKGKIINLLEADFVVELLKALNEFIPIDKNSYGVITPYAYQRKVLTEAIHNARLPHVTVNTIDSYQGVEKDVIVISNARTNGVGFLANPQRLNVAITRPKKCLILCGNFRNLQSVPAWRCLLKDAQQRNLYHEIGALDMSDIKAKVIQRILAKQ